MGAAAFRLFGEIQKAEEQDDGTIKVWGIASTGNKDSAGETITAAAMSAALPDYAQYPALREMHQMSAAGSVMEMDVDGDGITRIMAHVVDPVAVLKVKTGVYKGFSIGGRVLPGGRDPKDRSIIHKLKLSEISLVDRPANPEACIDLWKADAEGNDMIEDTPWAPANKAVLAAADVLAKAAGKPDKRNDFVVKARASLIAAHDAEVEVAEAEAAEVAEAVAKAEADALADGGTEVVEPVVETPADEPVAKAEGEGDVVADPVADEVPEPHVDTVVKAEDVPAEPVDPPRDLRAELEAAIAKADEVVAPPVLTDEAFVPTVGLEDVAKGCEELSRAYDGKTITKGLRGIASLSYAIYQLVSVQAEVAREAAKEGDGSGVPASIATGIKTLTDALIAMAKEEAAELMADLVETGSETAAFDVEVFAYADKLVDLAKADTDLMEKVGARNSRNDQTKLQTIHDHATALGAACSTEKAETADDIAKREADVAQAAATEDLLAKATTALGAMTDTVAKMQTRIETLEAQPAAAKAMTLTGLTVINKTDDVHGSTDDPTASFTKADVKEYLDSLTESERGNVLVKMSLANPISAIRR